MSEELGALEVPLVVCDANVFYSIVLTDLLLSLGVAGLFRPRWTAHIHAEWMRNLQANNPALEPAKIERRRALMDAAIEDCLITGYEPLIPTLQLPDANDRHVLAAAIHAQAQVIVTYNLRDFPAATLAPHNLTAQHPDEFLTALTGQEPAAVVAVLEEMRARKTRPPLTMEELVQKIANQKLPHFVTRLQTLL